MNHEDIHLHTQSTASSIFLHNRNNREEWRTKAQNKCEQKNSVALVRKRTILTERPPLVGEVSVNFSGQRVSRGQRNKSPRPLISGFLTGAATFLSSSSSIILTRLSRLRSRPTTSQKIWQRQQSNPGPLDL
jgi:hypothetical protein